jgi:hypothetical protein
METRNSVTDGAVRGALRRNAPWLTLGVLGLVFGSAVQARCGETPATPAQPPANDGRLVPVALQLVSDEGNSAWELPAIVGLWEFEWHSKGNAGIPDGTVLDFGTVIWHADGTEATVSGGRTPAVGDVCMGTWRQVGPGKFRLTHLAMGYGPPPGPPVGYGGIAVLDMTVTVGPNGNAYHGNFTLTQYNASSDPSAPFSEFDQSSVAFALSGTVSGRRVVAK